MDLFSKVMKGYIYVGLLPLEYAILDYHSIELLCFHYNGSVGVSFLLQQRIAFGHFPERHSDYFTFGLSYPEIEGTFLINIHHI
jgi:hypothetical protein